MSPITTGTTARLSPLSWPWQGRILLLSAIWGSSFLFIKIADRSFVPFEISGGRVAIAAVFLVAVLAAGKGRLPRGLRLWGHLAVAGLLMNAVPFTLIAWGEDRVSAVTAGLLNAATPLFVVPIGYFLLPGDRLGRGRLAGVAVGFVGVVVVLGAWTGVSGSHLSGDLACLGATVCYGLGIPYTRRFVTSAEASPTALAAVQLICATVEMALVSPAFLRLPTSAPLGRTMCLVALGVVCTGFAYILNYSIVREAGATNSSFVTYLIPLFSTLLGIGFLAERPAWYEPVGAAVVLVGVALTQVGLPGRASPKAADATPAAGPGSEHLGEEGARPLVLGIGEEVAGVAAFDDHA